MNLFRYCGEYFDRETGRVYLRARYYDPATSRMLSEDPVRFGLNFYTYCGSNPIAFVDPSGLAQVALRAYLEHYGGTVGWNSNTSTASGKLNGITVNL